MINQKTTFAAENNHFLEELYPFRENFFSTKDHDSMHFVDEGKKHNEAIVMAHGNPTWSFYYRNLIRDLKGDYRVIAPDHIGCGKSEKSDRFDYSLSSHIENLYDLIIHLKLKNIHLIVHDWGGAIGMGVAARLKCNKVNIQSITLLNTAAFLSSDIPFRISLCKLPIVGEIFVRAFNGFAGPATFMASTCKLSKPVKKAYLAPYKNYNERKAIAEFVKDIPLSKKHRSYNTLLEIEKSLPELECPKQVLWGGRDFCFNDKFYKRWKEIYPHAKFRYYKDAGHYVLEDQYDDVLSEIKALVKKTSTPAPCE